MSEIEHHIGKLRKIDLNEGYSVEDWCREKCQDAGVPTMIEHYDSWKETLQYHLNLSETYFFIGNEIWEAFDHVELDGYDDIYHLTQNGDGTLTFIMRFYNGGTNLTECIEEEIIKLKK